MKITKISPAVKTAGRYNVFVDEEFSFSLDESQLVKLGLRNGQEFSAEELAELKSESDFGKNYIRAVDLISRRLRSEREIRDYAFRKQWTKENTARVIERLRERGYLNDAKFAESFVRSRANLRNFSRRKMELELMKKGISKNIIGEILSESDEFDESAALQKLIAKKRTHYTDERKLIAYLMRQGFSYDDIKSNLK
ncbi:RecX family transcriptional regulator [Candidatus Saccharibacteria bacterium]|nr:RecX family transcriptional regulator [Candidatus Saccharibacteria bacterium]MCL1962884.1 RecX family transcriptional regulator [Candidatus Saccharibacteria bacterium]